MKAGEKLSATARAERSREATKAAIARELLYAGILARLWPSYVTTVDPKHTNEEYPWILVVESPAGRLTWRLSREEYDSEFFEWIQGRTYTEERAVDRMPTLLALASEAWE